jgi:hypothetical protein
MNMPTIAYKFIMPNEKLRDDWTGGLENIRE